jgi:hypothetical protein
MGIKFLCPNGHKLHVKSYLSGKKAICPKCGERVVVPAEDGVIAEVDAADDSTNAGSSSLVDVTETQTLTVSAKTSASKRAADNGSQQPPDSHAGGKSTGDLKPGVDPITESPSSVWYVRPATGGQYGPASGEIMRGWLKDGRVGASSLVWRAGWSEWRSAAEVFPQLGAMLAAPTSAPTEAAASTSPSKEVDPLSALEKVQESLSPELAAPKNSGSVSPMTKAAIKRRQQSDRNFFMTAVLLVVAIILVIVLMFVIRARSQPPEEETPGESPAAPAATAPAAAT